MLFGLVLAEGMKDFLQMFFWASGALYCLLGGGYWKEWWRGWEGRPLWLRWLFLITERLFSSDKGLWDGELIIFSGLISYSGEFCFVFGGEGVEPWWNAECENGFNEWAVISVLKMSFIAYITVQLYSCNSFYGVNNAVKNLQFKLFISCSDPHSLHE